MIQLSSHDCRPPGEKACSQRGAGVVTRDRVKRTTIGRPAPAHAREPAQAGDQTLLRMRVNTLDGMAGVPAGLGCAVTLRRPDELRTSVQVLVTRLAACA
jgi:hypothetical protein